MDGQGAGRHPWTIILDAGSGIRHLGKELIRNRNEIYFFLTHTHWDHIQGFPFFEPLYQSGRTIFLSPLEREKAMFSLLLEQMDGARFPLTPENILSRLESLTPRDMNALEKAGMTMSRIRVNHPGETYGYRLQVGEAVVVYIPDNELEPPYTPIVPYADLVAFCRGADILIHDAQFVEDDFPRKRGWGHSLFLRACKLAHDAGTRHLVLFHHDPDRTDAELDVIQQRARDWFEPRSPSMTCTVAFEGLELPLSVNRLPGRASLV